MITTGWAKTIFKYTGLGLLVFILGILVIGFVILRREYNKFQSNQADANLDLTQSGTLNADGLVSQSYSLLNGWNFVAFPFEPVSFTSAANLITEIAKNGGFVSTVSSWDGDRWIEFSQSGADQYGQDFPIVPGRAYFLRSHQEYAWKVYGKPLTALPARALSPGWNAIGFIPADPSKAENILDAINHGTDNAREIDHWWSGSWDVFVKRTYNPNNIKSYGNNFIIDPTKGYMLSLQSPATYEGGE